MYLNMSNSWLCDGPSHDDYMYMVSMLCNCLQLFVHLDQVAKENKITLLLDCSSLDITPTVSSWSFFFCHSYCSFLEEKKQIQIQKSGYWTCHYADLIHLCTSMACTCTGATMRTRTSSGDHSAIVDKDFGCCGNKGATRKLAFICVSWSLRQCHLYFLGTR